MSPLEHTAYVLETQTPYCLSALVISGRNIANRTL